MAFANFSLSDAYAAIITKINAQLTAMAGLFKDQTTGDFTGQIRLNSSGKRLESWNGSAWVAVDLSLTAIAAAAIASGTITANLTGNVTGNVTGTASGNVATSAYTAADVISKLLTVDGAGSGLDADTLQGQAPSYYLDSSHHTGTVGASRMAAGAVIQTVYLSRADFAQSTTVLPMDNTIPQSSEGWETLSQAFTPQFSNSKLILEYGGYHSAATAGTYGAAIFSSASANALIASPWSAFGGTAGSALHVAIEIDAVNTSARTYSARIGAGGAVTTGINGSVGGSGQYFGGVAATYLRITEIRQ